MHFQSFFVIGCVYIYEALNSHDVCICDPFEINPFTP